MVSDKVFTADGTSKIYSVDFNIISDNHCNVYIDNVLQSRTIYDIINNAIVFADAPTANASLIIQVGTTPDDLLTNPTDAGIVATNITDVNTVAANIPAINTANANSVDVTTVATDIANVNTTATDIANVNTTATNIADVNTVATNIAKVNTVADDIVKVIKVADDLSEAISEVETVANDLNETTSEIEVVSNDIANVNAVGINIANVNAAANNETNINTAVANEANINVVSTDITNVNTTATNIADVNTTATDIANINTTATNIANVNVVATNDANVTKVADIDADVTVVADNVNEVLHFAHSYVIAPSAPTTDLFEGKLYFNSTNGTLFAYTSGAWQESTNFVKGFIGLFKYVATAGQTVFTGADANGATLLMYAGFATNVFLNGMLLDKTDYTLSNNDTVTLALGTNALDEVVVHGYQAMTLVEAQQAQLARDAAQAAQLASEGARDTALSHKNDAATSASAALASENAAATSETNVSNDEAVVTAAKNSIDARYLVSATEPASPVEGTMWFDTVNNSMKVFDGAVFTETVSNISGVENSTEYTATAGQTTFAAAYNVGFVKVFLNGIMLKDADFTATNGTSIVLLAGAALDDTVYIQSFGIFELADTYTKAASDARFEPIDANIVKEAELKTVNGASLVGSGDIVAANGSSTSQVFNSSGTWTKPVGINKVYVELVGAGGGGGAQGESGGAGGYAAKWIDVSAVSSVTVTIGSGGSGGGYSGNRPSGGSTSFGSYLSASGGQGSQHTQHNGGVGGVGSGGDINCEGGGGMGHQGGGQSGPGGTSYFSGCGAGTHSSYPYIRNSIQGAGGTANSNTGGNGGNGMVVIWEYK